MIEQTKWFERPEEPGRPLGYFPGVVARLRGTPARLEELFRHLPRAVLIRRVNEGWSVQEHVGHLLDIEPLVEQWLHDSLSRAPQLTAPGPYHRRTDDADHNARDISVILGEFRARRLALVERLRGLAEQEVARAALHPGQRREMRMIDWAFHVAEHDDHHVARAWELSRGAAG